jgi:hypothetical protein
MSARVHRRKDGWEKTFFGHKKKHYAPIWLVICEECKFATWADNEEDAQHIKSFHNQEQPHEVSC